TPSPRRPPGPPAWCSWPWSRWSAARRSWPGRATGASWSPACPTARHSAPGRRPRASWRIVGVLFSPSIARRDPPLRMAIRVAGLGAMVAATGPELHLNRQSGNVLGLVLLLLAVGAWAAWISLRNRENVLG